LLYSATNTRAFLRAVLWACRKEAVANQWMSADPRSEMHIYPNDNRYCVVNNTDEAIETAVMANNKADVLKLKSGEIRWFDLRNT
jgi:1,3-beta-galactosyl-N-acetylhexosamine phosphorylase